MNFVKVEGTYYDGEDPRSMIININQIVDITCYGTKYVIEMARQGSHHTLKLDKKNAQIIFRAIGCAL